MSEVNERYGLVSPVRSRFPDRAVCRANVLVEMGIGFYRERLLRRLRFRGLSGRDASLFSAHEHLHGAFAFARLVGVFVGVR